MDICKQMHMGWQERACKHTINPKSPAVTTDIFICLFLDIHPRPYTAAYPVTLLCNCTLYGFPSYEINKWIIELTLGEWLTVFEELWCLQNVGNHSPNRESHPKNQNQPCCCENLKPDKSSITHYTLLRNCRNVTTENWNCVITVTVINWTMIREPNIITFISTVYM
jgi:hypothetical protein